MIRDSFLEESIPGVAVPKALLSEFREELPAQIEQIVRQIVARVKIGEDQLGGLEIAVDGGGDEAE